MDTPIPSSNMGPKLLQKMGWNEQMSIGREGQQGVEPLRIEASEDNFGIGQKEIYNYEYWNSKENFKRKMMSGEKEEIEKEENNNNQQEVEKTAKIEVKETPQVQTVEQKLAELLDSEGGISKLENVKVLISIMNEEKVPKNQTLCLSVLSNSRLIIKKRFIEDGGLNVLDLWLKRDTKKKNLMKVILNHLSNLPITYDSLKASSIGKTIKNLTKSTVEHIKAGATEILNKWKEIVTEANMRKKRNEFNSKELQPKKIQKTDNVETEKKYVVPPPSSFSSSNAFGSKSGSSEQKTITRKKEPVRTGVMVLESDDLKPKIIKSSFESAPISIDELKKERMIVKKFEKSNPLKNSGENNRTDTIAKSTMEGKSENDSVNNSPTNSLNTSQTNLKNEPTTTPIVRRKRVNWDSNLTSIRKIPKVKNQPQANNININNYSMNVPPRETAQSKYLIMERLLEAWKERLNNMPQDGALNYNARLKLSPLLKFNIARGEESNEVKIQAARLLEAPAFKSTSHLPASPSEPSEMTVDYDDSKVPIIPLVDVTSIAPPLNQNPIMNTIPSNINTPTNYNYSNSIPGMVMNNIPTLNNINIPMNNLPMNTLPVNNISALTNLPIPNIPNLANNINNPLYNNPNFNNIAPMLPTTQPIPSVDAMQNALISLLYSNLPRQDTFQNNTNNMNVNIPVDQYGNNNGNYNNDDKSQQICRFHSTGSCKRGKYCEFRHV